MVEKDENNREIWGKKDAADWPPSGLKKLTESFCIPCTQLSDDNKPAFTPEEAEIII